MKRLLRYILLLIACIFCGWTQAVLPQNKVLRNDSRTLRNEQAGALTAKPVLTLHSQDRVVVSFDQMSHEGHRFFYRVQHCNFLWQTTDGLFQNEFVESNQEDNWINKGVESQNTTTLYTHYQFTFPNAEVHPLISGNYLLTIYDDAAASPEAVAEVRIRMVEPLVNISGRVLTNTDIDWNAAHQQIEMEVKAEGLAGDLRAGLHTIVVQNGREDNAAINVPPTAQMGNSLIWRHAPGLLVCTCKKCNGFRHNIMPQYLPTLCDAVIWCKATATALPLSGTQTTWMPTQKATMCSPTSPLKAMN